MWPPREKDRETFDVLSCIYVAKELFIEREDDVNMNLVEWKRARLPEKSCLECVRLHVGDDDARLFIWKTANTDGRKGGSAVEDGET